MKLMIFLLLITPVHAASHPFPIYGNNPKPQVIYPKNPAPFQPPCIANSVKALSVRNMELFGIIMPKNFYSLCFPYSRKARTP